MDGDRHRGKDGLRDPDLAPAYDWIGRNLRNFSARGRAFCPLPQALARGLGIDREREPRGDDLLRLEEALGAAVARRHVNKPARAEFVDVPHAVALADLEARRTVNAAKAFRRAALRGLPLPDGHRLSWLRTRDPAGDTRTALVECGEVLSFEVRFDRFPDGTWEQGWRLTDATEDLMRAHGVLSGTGWFPHIDRGIRDATRQFLEGVRPVMLVVRGQDGKRNAHNAATYGSILPEGYALHPMVEPGHPRADANGVHGVGLVRLPGYAPRATAGPRLEGVRARLGSAPVDGVWMNRVIGPVLWKGRSLPPVPGRLARALGLPPAGARTAAEVEAVLGAALHAACDERRAGRGTARLTLARALALADAQAAELPDAEDLGSSAAWEPNVSLGPDPSGRGVRVFAQVGPITILAAFARTGEDAWSMGWMPDARSQDLARRLHAMRPVGAGGAGLFPLADRGVRAAIGAFLAEMRPEALRLDGLDARNNDHYAGTFGSIAPDGYALVRLVEPGHGSAGACGAVGIRFERLAEPVSGPVPA